MPERLCIVNGEHGYFHTWGQFSEPVSASPMVGGPPAGVRSCVLGIVEFLDRVERVYPEKIQFCDDKNSVLHWLVCPLQKNKESKDGEEEN